MNSMSLKHWRKNQLLINQQKICMQTFLFELSNSLNGSNCLPTMAEKSCGTFLMLYWMNTNGNI